MIRRLACSGALVVLLAGCGLKGDLSLPTADAPPDQTQADGTAEPSDTERDKPKTETP